MTVPTKGTEKVSLTWNSKGFVVVVAVMRQDVEERSDEIKAFAGDVGHLENWTYPLADELGGSFDSLVTILDEDRDFSGARRLEYASKLRNCLLEDLRWANVNLGYHDHDRNIECECDTQMLPDLDISHWHVVSGIPYGLLAHTNQAVIRSHHEQAIVGAAAQKTEHRSSQIPFVAC